MSNEMSDLERRCYVAACKVSPRGFAPSRDIVRAVLAEARNPDAVQSVTEEREAVAHAIELCATPYISEALADAALSALREIRAAEILAAEANERAALDWLTAHRNVEISHYSPVYADEDDDAVEWRVTRVSGGVNDREWTIIGRGETARAALMDAIEHGAGK